MRWRGAAAASGDDVTTVYSSRFGRPVVAGLAAAALLMMLGAAGCSGGAASTRPGCLMVVMSGVRADHTGAGGSARATTPTLDAVAAGGAWFDSAVTVSASPISVHASILTGLYPSEHNVTPDHPVMVPEIETLAE